jgi:hypothetical protein
VVGAPDRVRDEPNVIALFDVVSDQLLEEHTACRDPAMVGVGSEAIAVPEGAVMHDDPTDPVT